MSGSRKGRTQKCPQKLPGKAVQLDCGHDFWTWGTRLTPGDVVWCVGCKQPSRVP